MHMLRGCVEKNAKCCSLHPTLGVHCDNPTHVCALKV